MLTKTVILDNQAVEVPVPTVTRPGKAPKQVKNLDWLTRRRHKDVIETIRTTQNENGGAYVLATLKDGTTYETVFASAQNCRNYFPCCQWPNVAIGHK